MMKSFEVQYLEMLNDLVQNGIPTKGRTETEYVSLFGKHFKFEVSESKFPLLTTRKISDFWVDEFNAFVVKFGTNISDFEKYGHIWKPWADENGSLGPLYGEQLKRQYNKILDDIFHIVSNSDQSSKRRLVMTMWKYDELDKMGLPPCHGTVIQFNINKLNKKINMYCHQRSADVILGLPHNVAYYSLLLIYTTKLINIMSPNQGRSEDYEPGTIDYSLGDYHYYVNQLDGIKEQLSRAPYPEPSVVISYRQDLVNSNRSLIDVELKNYEHHPSIKFPAAEV